MADLEYRKVTKRYVNGVVALKELDLSVADGEFVILVGPSGCGKSTALRMLAGLDKPTSGDIRIGGTPVTGQTPGERDIAMVFQNYALYPHMTVFKNLSYGLRQRNTPRPEIRQRVDEISEILGITDLLDRRPAQLSGGQRQRVAMGRALVRKPQAFLLDEPLSNLDAKLRGQVRAELKRIHQRLAVTSIYVTHDQVEAMTLGDRICVLDHGELQQVGTPQEVYDHPANVFVAGFMGTPAMNLVPGRVAEGAAYVAGRTVARVPLGQGDVVVGLRPEHLRIVGEADGGVPVTVDFHEPLGSHVLVHTLVGDDPDRRPSGARVDAGSTIVVEAGPDVRPQPGERLWLSAEPRHIHLFDADSGAALEAIAVS